MGLRASKQIAKVIVDPVDFNVVYVAALGDLWAAGGERGVYKTTDGGLTWNRTLFVDDDTGVTELVMDPQNNKTLYAATYQRRRQQWGMNGGGPGSAIWKSTDGGQTWSKLETGLPAGPKGRIGLDVYRRNPNVLYARIEHPGESGVYRSDDAGASWRKMSDTNPRPMYFGVIKIDPQTDSRIYVLGVSLHVSDDGGKTFRADGAERIHVDHHALWINPRDPRHLIIGNDGGVSISHDRSADVGLDAQPARRAGLSRRVRHADAVSRLRRPAGQQHLVRPERRAHQQRHPQRRLVRDQRRRRLPAADGSHRRAHRLRRVAGRPHEPHRPARPTSARRCVPSRPSRSPATPPLYRFNWDTAMQLSPFDPATIYIGANLVLKSSDRGRSYQPISPDLTTNTDREALAIMGVPGKDIKIAKHDGVGSFGNIVTLEESAAQSGRGVGRQRRRHRQRDAGCRQDVDQRHREDVGRAEVHLRRPTCCRRARRPAPRTSRSTAIAAATTTPTCLRPPTSAPPGGRSSATCRRARSRAASPRIARTPNVLYLGTETGLWVSWNRGAQWTRIKANLPTMPIYEIKQHPRDNDLILASHARGIWILDDLTPIQQWAKSEGADAFVFDSEPAASCNAANDQMKGFEGDRLFLGMNPAPGATLAYRLKGDAKDVKFTIKDSERRHGPRDHRPGDARSQQGRLEHREVGPARSTAASVAAGARRAGRRRAGRWRRRFWRWRQQRSVRVAGHLQGDAECQRPRRADHRRDREGRSRDRDHRRRPEGLVRHRQGSARPAAEGERCRRDGAERRCADDDAAAADARTRRRRAMPSSSSTRCRRSSTRSSGGSASASRAAVAAAASAATPRTCAAGSAS